ncbi:hypothetical protein M4I21_12410 [Cellulophaga sp. 20_2_10]|uniref:hypothetical protein n=1 Tax=Cellulophaga sp. 20_2_10 TaxID=2942476 RepID=UPI00201AC7DF|nr:hypothetical protein [Cellulophaga sp. 20_2_10]MCL5246619.1 hypothetical protein [Cellulophaga sp. 20_2_10]
MKKITILLLLTSLFGYAQIDYKGLIKNIEDITLETDINTYFKGVPFTTEYGDIKCDDERFLRFYGVLVDRVKISNTYKGKSITMNFFDEKSDYNNIKTKLIALYGEPEVNEGSSSIYYEWKTDNKSLMLRINTEDGLFTEFNELVVTLFQ